MQYLWRSLFFLLLVVQVVSLAPMVFATAQTVSLAPGDTLAVSCPTLLSGGVAGQNANLACATPTPTAAPATSTPTVTSAPPTSTLSPTAVPPTATSTPTSPSVGGSASQSIFSDGFESGNFSAWSSSSTAGTDAVADVTTTSARTGMYGAHFTNGQPANNGHAQAAQSWTSSATAVTLTASLKVNSVSGDGVISWLDLMRSAPVYDRVVSFDYAGGSWNLAMRQLNGTMTQTTLPGFATGVWHSLVLGYNASSAQPFASLYIDGSLAVTITDTTIGTVYMPDQVYVGAWELAWNARGDAYVDDVSVSIPAAGSPTSTPTSTPVSATSTPTPTPTQTLASPTSTPTPTATAVLSTSTPTPTSTQTVAAPTNTPMPTPTAAPPTNTPLPTATAGAVNPLPLISQDVPAYASSGTASLANDPSYDNAWVGSVPAWLAYDLSGVAVARRGTVVLAWYNDPENPPYDSNPDSGWGFMDNPTAYTVEANPAPGGTLPVAGWVTLTTVTNNTNHSRQHVLNLTGYNWVRLNVTSVTGNTGRVQLNMDVHDASAGVQDDWIYIGDSVIQNGMMHSTIGSTNTANISQLVNGVNANYRPVYEDGSIGGTNSGQGAANISRWLATFPGHYVILNYGGNDWFQSVPTSTFYSNMASMVQAVLNKGAVPIVSYIHWCPSWGSNIAPYNSMITQLYQAYPQVIHGPDFYTYFLNNPQLISSDNIHPTPDGYAQMRLQYLANFRSIIYGF